jgi:hypothetical protein
MSYAWQLAAALSIVALALLALARRAWLFFRGGKKSGGCGSCGAGCPPHTQAKPLVTLGRLKSED